mgnify:CR=1 FL=1
MVPGETCGVLGFCVCVRVGGRLFDDYFVFCLKLNRSNRYECFSRMVVMILNFEKLFDYSIPTKKFISTQKEKWKKELGKKKALFLRLPTGHPSLSYVCVTKDKTIR